MPGVKKGINKALCPVLMIWLMVGAIYCSGPDAIGDQKVRKDLDRAMTKQYTRIFADARRSSFIDIESSAKGVVTWQSALHGIEEEVFAPEALLNTGKLLVMYNRRKAMSFSTDGARIWSENIATGSPVSVFDGKIYFRSVKTQANVLSAVNPDGSPVPDKMYILDSYDVAYPVYIEPLEGRFLAMCRFIPMPEEGETETTFYSKEYPTLDYTWVASFKGEPPLLPLHSVQTNRLTIFKPDQIALYNSVPGEKTEEEEEIAHYKSPMEKLLAASCDIDGNLFLIGQDKGKNMMMALSVEGEELWRWTEGLILDTSRPIQPPVLGVNNQVHLISGRSILTLSHGELVRKFDTDGEIITFCTALADGSLLIAAGLAFYRVDAAGEAMFSFEFDHTITAPPIAGPDGAIYVATTHTLTRVD